ncbi:RHS repeat-associated core domain-containing protein [Thiobacillus thioparus]|uniref:RHS repeat-associated core domain-containing protein n=1 Tax=Thiobacillus thioparus TaxID=931 RepID=UPI0003818189|nr:RHS repeat-associated core domain-containing protein [Thiobacillus thioparus]
MAVLTYRSIIKTERSQAGQQRRAHTTGRLTGAAGSFGSLGYSYDKNGNRTVETRNASTLSYVYSPPNWLYQRGSDTRIKSPNGNTVSSAAGSFAYDGYNRLVTSQTAAETTTYTYNALGERIKKINQNGLATSFHYGPNGELLYEQDQAGNTKAYVWLNGRPLARIDNSTTIYYYHVDHLGTPQAMTNASGTVVWKADYEPFGKATVTVNTIENNLRLPGQYYDRETGMQYNYFRDYDPTTGRYVEADPIGITGGLNVYEYARSNPLAYTDPLGLYGLPWETPPNFNPLAPKSGPTAPRGSLGASATIGSTTVGRSTNSDGVVWGQTTQISVGASVDICFNTPPPQACSATPSTPRAPDFYSYGVGKNLGLTVNSDSSFCINVGPSFGLPGGFGWNLAPRGK